MAGDERHFVLVHGACHGAWCWYKVRHLLESSGHRVTCVDLASAGVDTADPNSILTLEGYDEPLFRLLSTLPDSHKVILVGHSAAGLSLVHAIREFGSSKIALVVFVAATMLSHGFVSEQNEHDGVPDLTEFGDVYETKFGLGPENPPTSMFLKREYQRRIWSHLSPVEDSMLASMLLKPCPSTALATTRFDNGGDANADAVRRVYVKTAYDRMVKPEQQEAMIRLWPPNRVFVLQSDHSPFFSSPDDLAGILVDASSNVV